MAKLVLSMDGLVLKEIALMKERTSIGRKPHNDIQIDNLAISGEHAVIVTILNDSFLEDLGSTNGTLVNGQPVKKHFLQPNDVIEIGKYKLKYLVEATAKAGGIEFEKTMLLRPAAPAAVEVEAADESSAGVARTLQPGELQMAAAAASGEPSIERLALVEDRPVAATATIAPAAAAAVVAQPMSQGSQGDLALVSSPPAVLAHTMPPAAAVHEKTRANPVVVTEPPAAPTKLQVAAIQILTGSNAGRELEIVKPLTTLGKPKVQVAVITKRPQGYFITHVEGARHPIVNGKDIEAQPHPLYDHDVIEIAGVKMEFYYKS